MRAILKIEFRYFGGHLGLCLMYFQMPIVYDNYLIQHYTSTTLMVEMTKTMKQQGISL